jgi:serine/threonine-protein kinase
MPDLTRYDYREAVNMIKELVPGIETEQPEGVFDDNVTAGFVISTVPAAGERIDKNSVVYIKYSMGPEIREAEVPDVVGMPLSQAIMTFEARKLTYEYKYVPDDAPRDQVIFQDHEPGELVEEHALIKLQVSEGPAETSPTPPSDITAEPPPDTPTDDAPPETAEPDPAFQEDGPDVF